MLLFESILHKPLPSVRSPWIARIHISIWRPPIKDKYLPGLNLSGFLCCTSFVSALDDHIYQVQFDQGWGTQWSSW